MQQAFRAIKPVRYGGALTPLYTSRGIHSTAITPNPAALGNESKHLTETISLHDVSGFSRAISTGGWSSPLSSAQAAKSRPLGPRAKANFNTSIARQDLGFIPFESSIIFPSLEPVISVNDFMEVRVPFLPDNVSPAREPEPEPRVHRPIISTVADSTTHIAAPTAIMEGLNFNISFVREAESGKDDFDEIMMRAFRGA